MDQNLDLHECRQSRVMAAADIMAMALERGAPYLALAAAREAACSALLVLAAVPCRPTHIELEILKQVAACSPQHLAGRPTERQATVHAVLAILDRLFPRPAACEVGISSAAPGLPAFAHARGIGRLSGAPVIPGPGNCPNKPARSGKPIAQEEARPWA